MSVLPWVFAHTVQTNPTLKYIYMMFTSPKQLLSLYLPQWLQAKTHLTQATSFSEPSWVQHALKSLMP